MQLTLTFKEGSTNLDIAAALRYHANLIDGTKNLAAPAEPLTADEDAEETPAPKKTKAKTAAKAKPAAAASFEEDEETEVEEPATEESFEDEESFDETPAPKKAKAAAKITIDTINDACKAFARENGGGKDGREAVLKILKKSFKVTSISELDVEDYPKVLKALAV